MKNTYRVNEEAVKKIAERVYDNGSTVINRNDLEEMFPELKESEDEKVRKAIIEHFAGSHSSMYPYKGFTKEQIIAWLEKQGEQKSWSEEDEYYFGIIQYILNNECVGKADRENATTWFKFLKDRVQPKQEWSEEDDILLNDAIYTIKEGERFENELKHENCHDSHTYQVIISWLKSLKERVQPQNSSVTDEELAQAKKEAYNEALDKIEYNSEEPTFDDGWSAAIWYLKKRNSKPQNRWKPSDEQLNTLKQAINAFPYETDYLELLYDDLKKLKE